MGAPAAQSRWARGALRAGREDALTVVLWCATTYKVPLFSALRKATAVLVLVGGRTGSSYYLYCL